LKKQVVNPATKGRAQGYKLDDNLSSQHDAIMPSSNSKTTASSPYLQGTGAKKYEHLNMYRKKP